MIGKKSRLPELFISEHIGDFVLARHILKRVDAILDLTWLEGEAAHMCCAHIANHFPG